jgi:hypothetical protein
LRDLFKTNRPMNRPLTGNVFCWPKLGTVIVGAQLIARFVQNLSPDKSASYRKRFLLAQIRNSYCRCAIHLEEVLVPFRVLRDLFKTIRPMNRPPTGNVFCWPKLGTVIVGAQFIVRFVQNQSPDESASYRKRFLLAQIRNSYCRSAIHCAICSKPIAR